MSSHQSEFCLRRSSPFALNPLRCRSVKGKEEVVVVVAVVVVLVVVSDRTFLGIADAVAIRS